jgi:cytochrome c553
VRAVISRAALLAAAVAVLGGPAWADDISEGRAKARPCAVCHGLLGMGSAPDAPHLAGQPASYLSQQLRAFRSGERKHAVMNVMAKPLSDTDIEQISAWFASLQIEVKPPP